MDKPETDDAYRIFEAVGGGLFPSQCDDLMDEQDIDCDDDREAPLAKSAPPFARRRQDHRWR